MPTAQPASRVAVIGAGMAGAACAGALQRCGFDVTVFDKSRGVGGRMATRRLAWTADDGTPCTSEFDHGAQHFTAQRPRFRAVLRRAEQAGYVVPWHAWVHGASPARTGLRCHVAVPTMPALARHLLEGVAVQLGQAVLRLQRGTGGWQVVMTGGDLAGPFDQVVLALPPAQAAVLLAGHHDTWTDALCGIEMLPCWTLMAVTDDVDWPWDAAEPPRGPLAWVARNDRKPQRQAQPGYACWVAQATAEWSGQHIDAEPQAVASLLQAALAQVLPRPPASVAPGFRHASAHRWRYAVPARAASDDRNFWWDEALGLAVCGDFLAGGQVEGAWQSGDELADAVAAGLESLEAKNPPITARRAAARADA